MTLTYTLYGGFCKLNTTFDFSIGMYVRATKSGNWHLVTSEISIVDGKEGAWQRVTEEDLPPKLRMLLLLTPEGSD